MARERRLRAAATMRRRWCRTRWSVLAEEEKEQVQAGVQEVKKEEEAVYEERGQDSGSGDSSEESVGRRRRRM
eukprot:9362901-Alexandrium_andersonii.AAC.1